MNILYYLRCLGVNIPSNQTCPTKVFGDNFSVIQSVSNPGHNLNKKHVAISFHMVREAVAAGIVELYWIQSENNMSDILTKQLSHGPFSQHMKYIY